MKKTVATFFLILISMLVFAQKNQDEQLAIEYYKSGEYEKAAELFEKLYNKKADTYIYYYYYQVLLEMGHFDDLEKMIKKQIRAYPNVPRYKIDLGYAYEHANEIQKAEKEYQNVLKEMLPKDNAIRELYYAFLSKAKQEYAIETLLKGRKLLNDNKLYTQELTAIYEKLNQTDKIIEEALALIKDDNASYLPTSEEIIQNLLINDEDKQKYVTIKTILQKNVQKYPHHLSYVALLYWVYQLNKDYSDALVLAKSIDKRQKDDGARVYEVAKLAYQSRDYETAIDALSYLIAKGEESPYFMNAKIDLLNVKYKKLTSVSPVRMADAMNLEKEFKKLIDENGIHSGTADWIRKYVQLLAFYVNKPQEAIAVLNQAIATADRDIREKNQYKVDLADIQLFSGNVWDATLLYSQVEKELPNDTIGHLAKFKNAKLSFYIGEFAWAKSQLDVLRAATTKLIANDAMYFSLLISDNEEDDDDDSLLFGNENKNLPLQYFAKADFLLFQNKENEAFIMFDSVLLLSPYGPLTDDVFYQKAFILIKRQDYFGAELLLKKIIESYAYDILADDAIYKLAELYEYYLKDIPKSMECYQKLMREYPGSLYSVDARKRYRALRGDVLE